MDTSKMNNGDHNELSQDNYVLSDEQVKTLVKRKTSFLSGKITAKHWAEIKQKYERNKHIK